MSSFGRDDLSHLSMSLHMELNRTYGTSRIACFIWRHTSSTAFRAGQPGGRNCSSTPSRVTLIENFASHAAVQEFVDVKPDRTSPEIL